MRWVLVVLVALLMLFQYRLWLGEGSWSQKIQLATRVTAQQQENIRLEQRNKQLAAKVAGLRDGLEGIEERARNDLGMIRKGETYYMVIEPGSQ